ncbi:hypothetical protein BDV98DRAFT_348238 [Pterulicium gracile]|uniref:Uncharacterized protein n=1 Tax=Pterulicium gracile TaxID=1884261 RepID=A0A5C3QPB1_9AGAR|nr:hypothetical protein BDV98DRAFT_348238 [Pterula gracilis]
MDEPYRLLETENAVYSPGNDEACILLVTTEPRMYSPGNEVEPRKRRVVIAVRPEPGKTPRTISEADAGNRPSDICEDVDVQPCVCPQRVAIAVEIGEESERRRLRGPTLHVNIASCNWSSKSLALMVAASQQEPAVHESSGPSPRYLKLEVEKGWREPDGPGRTNHIQVRNSDEILDTERGCR